MNVWEILIIGIGLAADAFAVSLCKGLSSKQTYLKTGIICGAWFGIFQGLMPLLGWLLGSTVASYIDAYKSYISFILLAFLGGKMIVESVKDLREGKGCESCLGEANTCNVENGKDSSLAPAIMVAMAVATSIDALAVGFDFAVREVNILLAISIIGTVTFICCFIGSAVGAKIGEKFKTPAEIAGGVILIGMGLKFLIEGLI
ncbi:MAG: manganese efflux pump [Clostridia bacterium]|nr:manganese efflux pump [Clostridia bacterium]